MVGFNQKVIPALIATYMYMIYALLYILAHLPIWNIVLLTVAVFIVCCVVLNVWKKSQSSVKQAQQHSGRAIYFDECCDRTSDFELAVKAIKSWDITLYPYIFEEKILHWMDYVRYIHYMCMYIYTVHVL